ncbi:MAG TPA: DUF4124 domain-containing protein [Steroidobacteraceae bacterium]|nr:DUF4124 domain-containing protein [Steroidobacteraceae bacterium]
MDAIRTPGRRLLKLALACGIAAFIAGAWVAAADDVAVYKWLDVEGRIHYSDRPPPPDGKLISVETTAYARAHIGTIERPTAPPAPAPAAAKQPAAVSPEQKRAVAEDIANARAEQCKQARDTYQRYVQSRRLIRKGPDNEQIYLSDAEMDTERLNAKRAADEACEGVTLP